MEWSIQETKLQPGHNAQCPFGPCKQPPEFKPAVAKQSSEIVAGNVVADIRVGSFYGLGMQCIQ